MLPKTYPGASTPSAGAPIPGDDPGGFYHALKVAYAALVAVERLLGGFILVILAQVAEGAGALDLLDKLRHLVEPPVIQLLPHLFYVQRSQFVVQKITPLSIRDRYIITQKHRKGKSPSGVFNVNFAFRPAR